VQRQQTPIKVRRLLASLAVAPIPLHPAFLVWVVTGQKHGPLASHFGNLGFGFAGPYSLTEPPWVGGQNGVLHRRVLTLHLGEINQS
jgi:hypothetical protein